MSQTSSTQSSMKILLVENSRTARAVLTRSLEGQGFQVESVASGTEAISAIMQDDFQLVIMDVFLPQMNGYEAAQHIRTLESNKSNIPLIAFTSSTNERDKQICIDAGMNEYIIKSDDNKELFAVLEKYKNRLDSNQQAN